MYSEESLHKRSSKPRVSSPEHFTKHVWENSRCFHRKEREGNVPELTVRVQHHTESNPKHCQEAQSNTLPEPTRRNSHQNIR